MSEKVIRRVREEVEERGREREEEVRSEKEGRGSWDEVTKEMGKARKKDQRRLAVD